MYVLMLSVCRMSVVCQINCIGGITCGASLVPRLSSGASAAHAHAQSLFWRLNQTPVLFISYTLEL